MSLLSPCLRQNTRQPRSEGQAECQGSDGQTETTGSTASLSAKHGEYESARKHPGRSRFGMIFTKMDLLNDLFSLSVRNRCTNVMAQKGMPLKKASSALSLRVPVSVSQAKHEDLDCARTTPSPALSGHPVPRPSVRLTY